VKRPSKDEQSVRHPSRLATLAPQGEGELGATLEVMAMNGKRPKAAVAAARPFRYLGADVINLRP
jgi:hypothetical protein